MKVSPLIVLACVAIGCGDGASDPLAGGVRISAITFYQGPEVPLVREAQLVVERKAPLLAGRPGRVDVTVQVEAGAEPRAVDVHLELGDRTTGATAVLEQPATIAGGAEARVTVSFALAADALTPTTTLVAEVREQHGFTSAHGEVAGVRQPADGALDLDVRDAARFRVEIVPISLPAPPLRSIAVVDAARAERWRAALYAWLPVDEVELTVAPAPVEIDRDLSTVAGWVLLLGDLAAWRADAGLDDDVFVYAALNPTSQTSGIAGIAASLAVEQPYWRVAAGVLEGDEEAESSLVLHELGHAIGRSHAPCGNPGGPDFNYPYAKASIGVPGVDLRDGGLRSPDQYVDFMSYCTPTFVSDYQFGALFRSLTWVEHGATPRQAERGTPAFVIDPLPAAAGGAR